MKWQPMETAPKDGTFVLLCTPHGMYCAGFTDEDWSRDGKDDGSCWWMVDDNKHGPYPLRGDDPTHWMPLPSPPMGVKLSAEGVPK